MTQPVTPVPDPQPIVDPQATPTPVPGPDSPPVPVEVGQNVTVDKTIAP